VRQERSPDVTRRAVTKPRRRVPSRYHHGDLRRALLDAALIVIEEKGLDAVKMSDLARTLRVSVAAPFRHFESRDALLVALAEEGANKMVVDIEAAAARVRDPLEAQRARGVAYVRFAVLEPGYFKLLSKKDILVASDHLRALATSQEALMEPILGRHHRGRASAALAKKSAGLLAAQALTYGLARMIADGLLGDIDGDDAALLAVELTGVLGEGLLPRDA
jgi:AcrR family transcriptional regulator